MLRWLYYLLYSLNRILFLYSCFKKQQKLIQHSTIKVIHHINKLKTKKSYDHINGYGRAFDKIQHPDGLVTLRDNREKIYNAV